MRWCTVETQPTERIKEPYHDDPRHHPVMVTYNLEDPTFPHGTLTGYGRGCKSGKPCPATPSCTQIRRRHEKRTQYLRSQGISIKSAQPEQVQAAMDHVDRLVAAVPGASRTFIVELAGLSDSTLNEYRRNGYFGPKSVARILAVTVEQVAENTARSPAAPVLRQIRQMQAAGYPIPWLENKTGRSLRKMLDRVGTADEQQYVNGKLARRMQELVDEYGWRPAATTDGLSKSSITQTRNYASRIRYYPLYAYDDDGSLNLRLMPGHAWAKADDVCGRIRDALAMILDSKPTQDITDETGVYEERQTRLRSHLGLAQVAMTDDEIRAHDGHAPGDRRDRTRLVETRPGTLDAARGVLQALDGADDIVLACLRAGIAVPMGTKAQPGLPRVPKDHPALIAWRQEQDALHDVA